MALQALRRRLITGLLLEARHWRQTPCPQLFSLRDFSATSSSFVEDVSPSAAQGTPGAANSPSAAETLEAQKAAGIEDPSTSQASGAGPTGGGNRGNKSEPEAGEEPLSKEDLELFRRAAKETWHQMTKIVKGEEAEPDPILNLAGPGRPGWRNIHYDESDLRQYWELDLTGGKVPENNKNALLSPDAKLLMCVMCEEGYSIEEIAAFFKVRQQRVMAILALQKIDVQREEAGKPMHYDLQQFMEGGWACKGDGSDIFPGQYNCTELFGSGERHVRLLPKAPHYETRIGKDGKPVHRNLEELEEKIAVEEEKLMVEEFREKLLYNLGEVGKTLKRDISRHNKPRRPKEGFSLVVKPSGGRKPYVAQPDGTRRELNEDESVLQKRQRVRPRRRMMA